MQTIHHLCIKRFVLLTMACCLVSSILFSCANEGIIDGSNPSTANDQAADDSSSSAIRMSIQKPGCETSEPITVDITLPDGFTGNIETVFHFKHGRTTCTDLKKCSDLFDDSQVLSNPRRLELTTRQRLSGYFTVRAVDAKGDDVELTSTVNEFHCLAKSVKMAFTGDQNTHASSYNVVKRMAAEQIDYVSIQGDLGYGAPPTVWQSMMEDNLGPDVGYFASPGNHDIENDDWDKAGGYADILTAKLASMPGVDCQGSYHFIYDSSVDVDLQKISCLIDETVFLVLIGTGIPSFDNHEKYTEYLEQELISERAKKATQLICSWHLSRTAFQLGTKGNDVRISAYETCRKHGAIIATAHEHSYSRTLTLSDMENLTVASPDPNRLTVRPGETFTFVNGLGGSGIRNQDRCTETDPCDPDIFGAKFTTNQGAETGKDDGALVCNFNPTGYPGEADCEVVTIEDRFVVDKFTIHPDPAP